MGTSSAVSKFKMAILEPEWEDARYRLSDRGYWGDSGEWVVSAIQEVENAIGRVPYNELIKVADWIDAVIEEVVSASERFRVEAADPEGYGIATMNACVARLRKFRDACDEFAPDS